MQQLSCIFKVALLRTDTQCCTRSISCAGNVIFWVRLDSEELPQPSSFSCLEHSHSCFFFKIINLLGNYSSLRINHSQKVAKHLKDRIRSPKNSTSVPSWLDNPSHTSMSSFGDFMVTTRDYHCTMNHCHEWQLVTASYHDLSWSIMIHSDLSWSIVIYHDPSWTIIIYCVHIIFSGRMNSLSIGWNGVPRNGIDPPPAFVTRLCGCGSGIGFPFFHGVIPIAGLFTLW